jgi:hypothetical protein
MTMAKSQQTKPDSESSNTQNPIVHLMEENGIPLTRDNYLLVAYLGHPPKEIDPEVEEEMPGQFRRSPSET